MPILCFGERPKFVKSLLWLLLQICPSALQLEFNEEEKKLTVRLNLFLLVITVYHGSNVVIIFGLKNRLVRIKINH